MDNLQTRAELQVFRQFAEVCPLGIIPESITRRNPPEPDLLCQVDRTQEYVAFELVEIIDEDWARVTSGMFRERAALQQAYTSAESELRSELDRRLGDALVYVAFKSDLTARQRRSAVPLIVGALSAIEPGFVGDWAPSSGDALDSLLRIISITRGDFAGPEFDIEAVGSIGEPTLDRIRAKSRKAYSTPHPIELLAYYELQPLAPEALWLPGLQSFLRTENLTWSFRHLWVFDVGSKAIVYSAPRQTRRAG